MSETRNTLITAFAIEHMTVDLFRFWLDREWPRIMEGLELFPWSPPDEDGSPYMRSRTFFLGTPINESVIDFDSSNLASLAWAQMRSDEIRVEIADGGEFRDRLLAWVNKFFGINVDMVAKEQPLLEKQLPTLSPAEQDWLVIIWQSEYEYHHKQKPYFRFCIDYNLSQPTYETYKTKYNKEPTINLKQWATSNRPADADQRFQAALKSRT